MSHRRPALLLAAFAVILTAAWYKERENRRDWEAMSAWKTRDQWIDTKGLVRHREVMKRLSKLRNQPGSRNAAEAIFADGSISKPKAIDSNEVSFAIDVLTKNQYKLTFENETLTGYGAGWPAPNPHPYPAMLSRKSIAESIRQVIPSCALILWFVFMLGALARRDWRWLEDSALVAALAAGAAWLVDPMYTVSLQGVLSNDSLVFALIMLTLTTTLIGARLVQEWEVWDFRFSLRGLLLAVAAVAILLAIGPVGYAALGVALLAWLIVTLSFAGAKSNRG